jgi:hypothetical protein
VKARKLFAAVGVVAVVALVAVVGELGANNLRTPAPGPPTGGTLAATITQPSAHDVAAGFGSIWVSGGPDASIPRRRVSSVD